MTPPEMEILQHKLLKRKHNCFRNPVIYKRDAQATINMAAQLSNLFQECRS